MSTLPTPESKTTLAHRLIRWSSPLVAPFAGRRFFPLWAILEHRGRKSGRVYSIPVVARRSADGFVIPMAFGEKADWVRNVLASGTCSITWKGRRYHADQAQSIDHAQAAEAFTRIQRKMLPVIGVKQFLRVRATPAE